VSVDHRARLIELARGTAWLMDALRAVRKLSSP